MSWRDPVPLANVSVFAPHHVVNRQLPRAVTMDEQSCHLHHAQGGLRMNCFAVAILSPKNKCHLEEATQLDPSFIMALFISSAVISIKLSLHYLRSSAVQWEIYSARSDKHGWKEITCSMWGMSNFYPFIGGRVIPQKCQGRWIIIVLLLCHMTRAFIFLNVELGPWAWILQCASSYYDCILFLWFQKGYTSLDSENNTLVFPISRCICIVCTVFVKLFFGKLGNRDTI